MTEKVTPLADSQSQYEESCTAGVVAADKSLSFSSIKSKNYRVKNNEWHCRTCSIYCNSTLQFEMHLVSQKHKIIDQEQKARRLSPSVTTTETIHESTNSSVEFNFSKECGVSDVSKSGTAAAAASENGGSLDENNNHFQSQSLVAVAGSTTQIQRSSNIRIKSSYSPIEISQNLIAIKFNVNAEKYLIPESKKNGKFEKFGFYCSLCNAYMTGQIQLIMHVKGARHQYFSPNEIPGYKSSKLFNPNQYFGGQKHKAQQSQHSRQHSSDNDTQKTHSSIVNHVNEIKINNYTSTISPALSHSGVGVGVGGGSSGTYYDYLLRNEALMYGSQNHNHSHQHYHHHHQRGMFNSLSNLGQVTPNASAPNGSYQMNGQSSGIDYFNQHHHHHSSIYLTPSLIRQQHVPKYLQLTQTMLQYTSPQLSAPLASSQNYGSYMNERPPSLSSTNQQHQTQMATFHQTPPPPPPASVSSSASSQENINVGHSITPVSSYQLLQNNATDQIRNESYRKALANSASRLKNRFNANNGSNVFKDVTNIKLDDSAAYRFNQTPQYSSNGISIITSKPHQIHHHGFHHGMQQPHHQNQCNFYFSNAQVPSSHGDANNLNELATNQATSY